MHLVKDFDLDSNLYILHRDEICSSGACIELDHLKIGTASENMLDNKEKRKGEDYKILRLEHCRRGHLRTKKNIDKYGSCKICLRLRNERNSRRRRQND